MRVNCSGVSVFIPLQIYSAYNAAPSIDGGLAALLAERLCLSDRHSLNLAAPPREAKPQSFLQRIGKP